MLNISFKPFPELSTQRLTLRQIKMEDENEIFALRSDDRVNQFLDRLKAHSIEDARSFINKINTGIQKNELIFWAINFKNETRLIGTICLWNISKENDKAEIGYELYPDFQGKGIMQEAFSKVMEYGFEEMKLQTIEAYTTAGNHSSIKLLEKYHFKKETTLENKNDEPEGMMKIVIYSLTNQTK